MRTRLGLKVLGLSALVMGLMAIGTAGVAHAEAGACWKYLLAGGATKCFGENVNGVPLEARPTIKFENNTGTLLIANVNLEVLCTSAKFVGAGTEGMLALNGEILLGRVQFEGCISLSRTPTLSKLNTCTPNDPVAGLGKILTEKGTGLIVLHLLAGGSKIPLVKLSPDVGLTLAKIFLGEECAVSEELIVTGHLDIQDTGGKTPFEEHKKVHLIEESSLKLMTVGVNQATIDGTAEVSLEGDHSALFWGGKPA